VIPTRNVSLVCWVCEESFQVEEPRGYAYLGRGSDLCPRPIGPDPLPQLVHTCPKCGFAGDGRAFEAAQADEQVRLWVLAGGLGGVETDGAGCAKYQRAAQCHANRRKPSPFQLSEYYLAASWSAQLEGAPEAAGALQEQAARYLEQALLEGEVADGERAIMTYLAGELHRRSGAFQVALQLFDEAAVEFTRHGGPKWLLCALGQQAGLAREGSAESAELAG